MELEKVKDFREDTEGGGVSADLKRSGTRLIIANGGRSTCGSEGMRSVSSLHWGLAACLFVHGQIAVSARPNTSPIAAHYYLSGPDASIRRRRLPAGSLGRRWMSRRPLPSGWRTLPPRRFQGGRLDGQLDGRGRKWMPLICGTEGQALIVTLRGLGGARVGCRGFF